MYKKSDYIRRGFRFLNNNLRPGHKKISTLMLYSTDLCDSRCKHCLMWAKRPVRHIPFEKIVELMSSKCVGKHTLVGLEGGEFLMHPEAMQILEWFSKNHPYFDLLSNCLNADRVIDAVKKYPPKRLFLSLDGTKETYLHMRGKDGYDDVLRVIDECKSFMPISLMFTLSPYNSFADMEHVIEIAKKNKIDVRIGMYSNMSLLDTIEKAHETDISSKTNEEKLSFSEVKKLKEEQSVLNKEHSNDIENIEVPDHDHSKIDHSESFKKSIPENIRDIPENLDFLLLYDEWRKKKLKLRCRSILDSLVIHPDGSVPICQNLGLKLGSIHEDSLDNIFNSLQSQKIQQKYSMHCNQCWVNFHRKYDIVLMRSAEKLLPKFLVEKIFGYYHWTDDRKMTYKKLMKANGF